MRTIFARPDAEHVHPQLDVIAGMLGRQFLAVKAMHRDAAGDLPAFTGFPVAHWKKIWSTNPLAQLNSARRHHNLAQMAEQCSYCGPFLGASASDRVDLPVHVDRPRAWPGEVVRGFAEVQVRTLEDHPR
jgi:hypothetical protein